LKGRPVQRLLYKDPKSGEKISDPKGMDFIKSKSELHFGIADLSIPKILKNTLGAMVIRRLENV
jgi:hypothetical protein